MVVVTSILDLKKQCHHDYYDCSIALFIFTLACHLTLFLLQYICSWFMASVPSNRESSYWLASLQSGETCFCPHNDVQSCVPTSLDIVEVDEAST